MGAVSRPLMADCVLFEQYCNLHCDYCFLSHNFKTKLPPAEAEALLAALASILQQVKQRNIPIMKLSGGEIFMLPGLVGKLKENHDFARLQVLTNGTLLTRTIIDELAQLDNFGLQMTLDGHTFEANSLRFTSRALFQRVMDNMQYILEKNIPLEINMCLTRNNVAYLEAFLKELNHWKNRELILYPIPVRESEERFSVLPGQLEELYKILEHYEQYASILPPIFYFNHMIHMLETGAKHKDWQCWVPELILGLQGNGDIKACPEVGVGEQAVRANLFHSAELVSPGTAYLLRTRCRTLRVCSGCYTHYELMNAFINGSMSRADLESIWFFRNEQVMNSLEWMRGRFLERVSG